MTPAPAYARARPDRMGRLRRLAPYFLLGPVSGPLTAGVVNNLRSGRPVLASMYGFLLASWLVIESLELTHLGPMLHGLQVALEGALAIAGDFVNTATMTEFVELAARGKTQWWRYLLAIVLAIILWLVMCTATIVALGIARLLPADISAELTQPTHIEVFYGSTGAMFGLLLATFAIAARLVHGKRPSDVIGVWRWRRLAIGAAVWIIVCVIGGAIDYALQPNGFHISGGAATWRLAAWAVPSLTIQTFTEEFIFRGYVTQALLLATRRPLATAVLSGLCFATLHIPNGWPQAASALAFGIITALIAIRTAGIVFTFGLHLANNLFGALIVVSANDVFRGSPALITQATPQLMWFDTALPFLALLALLWLAARPRLGARPAEAEIR